MMSSISLSNDCKQLPSFSTEPGLISHPACCGQHPSWLQQLFFPSLHLQDSITSLQTPPKAFCLIESIQRNCSWLRESLCLPNSPAGRYQNEHSPISDYVMTHRAAGHSDALFLSCEECHHFISFRWTTRGLYKAYCSLKTSKFKSHRRTTTKRGNEALWVLLVQRVTKKRFMLGTPRFTLLPFFIILILRRI